MSLAQKKAAVLLFAVMLVWTTIAVSEVCPPPPCDPCDPCGGCYDPCACDPEGPGCGCEDGCTLTPGYWRTHSQLGPAPYDAAWALLGPSQEQTVFFLSGQTYYQVLWLSTQSNAYYILASAYAAAELNMLNGASAPQEVQDAFDDATGLLQTYTPSQIGALRGEQGVRPDFIDLAEILDDYNNGLLGPGHCKD